MNNIWVHTDREPIKPRKTVKQTKQKIDSKFVLCNANDNALVMHKMLFPKRTLDINFWHFGPFSIFYIIHLQE